MTVRQKKCLRRIIIIVLAVILAIAAAFLIYTGDYYHADTIANTALISSSSVTVSKLGDDLVFTPAGGASAGLIFYPGGKVEYTAYAPLMHRIAEQGIQCVLVKMPFNLAVLDISAADGIAAEFPEISSWYIGGHSLGGTMAASCAARHTGEFSGMILLASYSTADISGSGLKVLSMYGTWDGVLNMDSYQKNRPNLPADADETVINGGNHAGFGSYGVQSGDGTADITAAEQMEITASAVAGFISE